MLTVAITGGIACGKSTVRRALARRGYATLDLDGVAHRLLTYGGPVRDAVASTFGREAGGGSGTIERSRLAALVFGDEKARRALNEVMHPAIRAEEAAWAQRAEAAGVRIAFVDGALLIETGRHLTFDRCLVVWCTEAEQIRRLRVRDGLSLEAAGDRIAAQMPIADKRRLGTDAIGTDGSRNDTDRQVAGLLADLTRVHDQRLRLVVSAERAATALEMSGARSAGGIEPLALGRALGEIGLDLATLARRLGRSGPWYETPSRATAKTSAVALMPVLATFLIGRGLVSLEHALAVAASAVRLVEGTQGLLAPGCLAMEALLSTVRDGRLPLNWRRRLGRWRRYAEGEPHDATAGVTRALDAVASGSAARREGVPEERDLAGALGVLAGGGARRASDEALSVCRAFGLPD